MRVAGIDPGEKRVGLALGDTLLGVATPAGTLAVAGMRDAVARVAAFLREKGVEEAVVGLPLNMNGTSGPAAEKALKFADFLGKAVSIPVRTWDERLTTAGMQREMIEAGVRRDRRGQMVDQLAAQQILQGFLDAKTPPAPTPLEPDATPFPDSGSDQSL